MEPKFRKGQELFDFANQRNVFVKYPNMRRLLIRKNNRTTGFEEEFTGTYFCSWYDEKGKLISGDIEEDSLSNQS